MLRILLQRVFVWQRRQARELGVDDPRPAAVSFLHLFGSALNLHPHTHSLVPDAVFWPRGDRVELVPLLAPTDEEVEAICAQVARRVLRRVEARLEDGPGPDDDDAALVQVPTPLPMPWADSDEDEFEHPSRRMRRCAEVEGFSQRPRHRRAPSARRLPPAHGQRYSVDRRKRRFNYLRFGYRIGQGAVLHEAQ